MPVVQDGDHSYTESLHCADYVAALAAKEGRENILPATPAERFRTGIFLEQQVSPLLGPFYGHLMAQAPEEQASTKEKLNGCLSAINKALGAMGGPFLLGGRPTFGDFMLYPFIERLCVLAHYRGFEVEKDCTNFFAWRTAMEGLHSVKNTRQEPQFFVDGYAKYASGKK